MSCATHEPGPTTWNPSTQSFEQRCRTCDHLLAFCTRGSIESGIKELYHGVVEQEKSNAE